MRTLASAAALLLALTLALPAAACLVPPGADAARSEALLRINQERGRAGLAALQSSPVLDRVAQDHACDNATRGRISHTGSDGSQLGQRLRRVGYAFRRANENVAFGHSTASAVIAGWMHSPGHRQNILDRGTREFGLGLARAGDGRLHWVMVSATPLRP